MSGLDLATSLNPEQLAAVTHGDGPQLVLAGAGSGKTRVITHRIAWLVDARGVDPGRIVAVTFTNKAASEMRERVAQLLGLDDPRPGYSALPTFVGTFHRLALRLLRRYGERVGLKRDFAILDSSDQKALIKLALKQEELSEKAFSPNAVLSAISSAKNQLIEPNEYDAQADDFFQRRVALVYRRYQGLLHKASGVDFDDMIALAVKLLEGHADVAQRIRWQSQHLLVDEYQDTNHAQLRLIAELSADSASLTAVGDEDQSIYRWRGAELSNILEFETSFPGAEVRMLERNYRSTQNILNASGALVAHNQQRRGKRLWTETGGGEKIDLYRASDERDEARWVVNSQVSAVGRYGYSGMGILVRTNAQTRALEEELLRQEVPYSLIGGTRFYERAEIKDLVAYLRLLRNPRDFHSMQRVINQPARGIGRTTLGRLYDTADALGQPPWDVLFNDELGGLPKRSATALRKFRDLIVDLQAKTSNMEPADLLKELIEAVGYDKLYNRDEPEGYAKLENIDEFISAAEEFRDIQAARSRSRAGVEGEGDDDHGVDGLTAFLDHISLVSDIDGLEVERGISVMTLHSAKGLEFPLVTITGLEDGLLPHFNSQGDLASIEEERRLLYVGMTRAREKLILSCCRRRRIAGFYQDQLESPFLGEIPEELIQLTESPSLFAHSSSLSRRRSSDSAYNFFSPSSPSRSSGSSSPRSRRAQDLGYEPDPGAGSEEIHRGTRVLHPTLGQGVVLELEGSGGGAKITVYFDHSGKRRLVAKYANLEPL